MGIIDRLRGRAIGEQSGLRVSRTTGWRIGSGYKVDSSRVDYELARELYRNTNDRYKLGAAFAKPVVNTLAGFMGVPNIRHRGGDDDTQAFLDETFERWRGKILRLQRNALRDGDVFARIDTRLNRFDDRALPELYPRLIPPEWCTPIHNPITGGLQEFVIAWPVYQTAYDQGGKRLETKPQYTIIERITPTERTFDLDGAAPPGTWEMIAAEQEAMGTRNTWGFVPVTHFKNEGEENQIYGSSELEPVLPFIRAYHDVMKFAIEGAKMFARPKVSLNVQDVGAFLANNFSADELATGRIQFSDREIMFFQGVGADAESMEFVTADSGLQGTTLLLEFLFYCIVDVSQTPEFAFGTAVASSKASVSEQMPVLDRNVERKRGEYEDPYKEFSTMFVAMAAKDGTLTVRPDTYETDISWDEIDPQDDTAYATMLSTFVSGLRDAVDAGFMSLQAAVEELGRFVPSMLAYVDEESDDDELRRIVAGRRMLDRLAGGTAPELPVPEDEEIDDEDVLPFPGRGR